jgi:hypothetical protein
MGFKPWRLFNPPPLSAYPWAVRVPLKLLSGGTSGCKARKLSSPTLWVGN